MLRLNNRNPHRIEFIDSMSDIDNYRIGNLIYYHFDHQTSFNDAAPVKCIARIIKMSSDGKPQRLAIVGPNDFIVEIEAVEDHIESIRLITENCKELERLLLQHNPYPSPDLSTLETFHQAQNLYFDERGVKMNVSCIGQTDMWNRYIYYEQE